MVLFRRQRDPHTHKKVLAAKAYRGDLFDAVSVGRFLDDNANGDALTPLTKSPKVLRRKKKSKASRPEASGDSEQRRPRRGHRHRHKSQDAEEKGDDYYFPQHVDHDEYDDAGSSDDIGEEEDVLDLDDDNDDE